MSNLDDQDELELVFGFKTLEEDFFGVARVKGATGNFVYPNGEVFHGEGFPMHVVKGFAKALELAEQIVRGQTEIDCSVYDHQGNWRQDVQGNL